MNRSYDYVRLDVFTQTPFKGNPLAVVPNAQGLSDFEMQAIAAEFNLSETVFLLPPQDGNASIVARIFTPRRELPFAGHPTIGAAAVATTRLRLSAPFFIEEGVGPVKIDADGELPSRRFWLTTPPVSFHESLDPSFCARLLGLDVEDIRIQAPQFISAGSPLLCICLTTPDAVDRAVLQQQLLPEALGSVNSVATFVFARKEPQSAENFDVYSRMFAPQTGIQEDPATGGATGPLAAYMMKHDLLPSEQPVAFVSEQGTKMGRQSLLYVRTGQGEIQVGGYTATIGSGSINLSS